MERLPAAVALVVSIILLLCCSTLSAVPDRRVNGHNRDGQPADALRMQPDRSSVSNAVSPNGPVCRQRAEEFRDADGLSVQPREQVREPCGVDAQLWNQILWVRLLHFLLVEIANPLAVEDWAHTRALDQVVNRNSLE